MYQNLFIIYNLERNNFKSDDNFKEKLESTNRRIYRSDHNNDSKNLEEQDKENISKIEYGKKYHTLIDYGKYNNSMNNKTNFNQRPSSSLTDNTFNFIPVNKGKDGMRELENNEKINNIVINNKRNYLVDSKDDDDLVMSSINTRNDLGNFSEENYTSNINNQQFRMQNSQTENLIRGDFSNHKNYMIDEYRFNKERNDTFDASIGNNKRERIIGKI